MAGGQRLIDVAWRHAVNDVCRLHLIVREDAQHAARTAVIGGNHRIAARRWVVDTAKVDIVEDRQIGGPGINVAGRIEQEATAWRAGFPLRAEDVFPGGMLHHLHQPHRVGTADRIRVKGRFSLHNRQNQRLVDAVFAWSLPHHAQIFVGTLIKVVRYQINGHAINNVQAVAAFFHPRLQQIVGEARGTPLPANSLAGVIDHLAVQERFFGNLNVVGVGVKVDRAGVVTHQQRGDDGLAQARSGFGTGDGFDGDGTVIEVDMATRLVAIGVFNVVLRPGDQNFVKPPDVFNIMGELTHQNVKTVGVFYPSFIVGIAFLIRGTGNKQRRYQCQCE